jgi:2-keto-3-deoxy-L-rhamnonate aldolase RhmA
VRGFDSIVIGPSDLSGAPAIPGESKNRLKKVGLANGFREQLV